MQELLQQLLDDDLSALRGMRLKAKVPLREGIVNEMLLDLLARAKKASAPSAESTSGKDREEAGKASAATPQALYPDVLRMVEYVKHLSVEMKHDQLVLHLEMEID